nr:hypothetical protein [Mute swan feces associated noda-like virus 8]
MVKNKNNKRRARPQQAPRAGDPRLQSLRDKALDCLIADRPGARGAKFPDGNGTAGVPYQVVYEIPVTGDANGEASVLILPRLNAAFYASPTIVSSFVTSWGTATVLPGYDSLQSSFEMFRIVSGSASYEFSGNLTESAGRVSCQSFVPGASLTNAPNGINALAIERKVGAILQKSLGLIKPVDLGSRHFRDIVSTIEETTNDYTGLTYHFRGCSPNKPLGVIEVTLNLELTPKAGDFTSKMATPAAADNPLLRAVIDSVAVAIPAIITPETMSAVASASMLAVRGALARRNSFAVGAYAPAA